MSLVNISSFDIVVQLYYATPDNITKQAIYKQAIPYLHAEAVPKLKKAIGLAGALGLKLKIWDAYRPEEAQWALWNAMPNSPYVANPKKGSLHTRGIALDLTLVDQNGDELDMGTKFDDFSEKAHHANCDVSLDVQKNRFLLLGIMTVAGWEHYSYEWWHYQLTSPKKYPLLKDITLPISMM
jgi:zinc D-Ala-D-Ala dipeptidase